MPCYFCKRMNIEDLGGVATTIRQLVMVQFYKMSINIDFKHNVMNATDMVYEKGGEVLVWREKGH